MMMAVIVRWGALRPRSSFVYARLRIAARFVRTMNVIECRRPRRRIKLWNRRCSLSTVRPRNASFGAGFSSVGGR